MSMTHITNLCKRQQKLSTTIDTKLEADEYTIILDKFMCCPTLKIGQHKTFILIHLHRRLLFWVCWCATVAACCELAVELRVDIEINFYN